MFKITDTRQLGTIYTINDQNSGEAIGTLQVIYSDEILEVAHGEYNDTYADFSEYLSKSVECFSGYEENQLYRTLWWACVGLETISDAELESELTQAFEHAIKHGYDTIILEDIPAE